MPHNASNLKLKSAPKYALRLSLWGAIALLWVTPMIAMQFTPEVKWDPFDFVLSAIVLIGVGGAFEFALRQSRNLLYRVASGLTLLTAFLLIWINAAVGIIGPEGNPTNLLFVGVLLIGLVGAIIARLQPRGMGWTLLAMTVAQGAMALYGLTDRWQVAALTSVFAGVWLICAVLFFRSMDKP